MLSQLLNGLFMSIIMTMLILWYVQWIWRHVAMCYNTYFIFSISFDTIQCCNSENWRTKKESYNYINKFLHWDWALYHTYSVWDSVLRLLQVPCSFERLLLRTWIVHWKLNSHTIQDIVLKDTRHSMETRDHPGDTGTGMRIQVWVDEGLLCAHSIIDL